MIQFMRDLIGWPKMWRVPKPYWVMSAGRPLYRVPNFRSMCYDG